MNKNTQLAPGPVHFIGIGGIGVSALARMMQGKGRNVSGSDASSSAITEELKNLGIKVSIGQKAENVPLDVKLVIYTIAVKDDNPELKRARELGATIFSYPEALGIISRNMHTIAVSGTHGKTTTTAMIAKVLKDAGLDPTVIVGSLLREANSNFIQGKGKFLVVEACEYWRSFLNLHPHTLVITNIEEDHLDYYKDLADIQSAFRELAERVPSDGHIITNASSQNMALVIAGLTSIEDFASVPEPVLRVPGKHNIENARAAFKVGEILGIGKEQILKSLLEFEGTWRRFEYKGMMPEGALVYDDYAHHPTEIRSTIEGAREMFPGRRVLAVFQPHLFSRTKEHLGDFQKALSLADDVIVAPIYAAREAPDPAISNKILAKGIHPADGEARVFDNLDDIAFHIRNNAKNDALVLVMGAGDIYKLSENLVASPVRTKWYNYFNKA